MTQTQKIFAFVTSLSTFLVIVELVRRRKLKEEYAWLWILATLGMVGLSVFYPLVEWFSREIGAVTVTTTLFIFGLLFLLLISVHFSTVISRLTQQVLRLTQEIAIMSAEQRMPPPGRGEAEQPASRTSA